MIERIGDATLYLGDCREIAPTLEGVDCVVTDPPYGIGLGCDFNQRGRGNLAGKRERGGKPVWIAPSSIDYPDVHGDDEPFDPTPWLSTGKARILWGANYYADKLPPSGGWLVWDKERPADLDQATCELAWTDCIKGVRIFRHHWNGFQRASERQESYHPTQKPVVLMEWLLSFKWVPPGRVLDPYMGAGPVGVACCNLGRPFIGIEIEQRYFDIACQRIDASQRQQRLFA